MLSRHADDLFWAGRYVERAEDTARLLDVTYHGLLESRPTEVTAAWREVLEVLFLDEAYDGDPAPGPVTAFLVLDQENASSIIASVRRARENARGVRDRISTEMWEAINTFYLDLADRDLGADVSEQPYHLYRMVKNRCQMIAGVAAETMPRDDGYRFFNLGRMLERAEMTCRLLAVRYASLGRSSESMEYNWWVALLKSVAAFEAYLKQHRAAALEPELVLEFLLLAPDFPRSVLYCLRGTEAEMERLAGGDTPIPAQRLLGRVRARVEFCDIEEIIVGGLAGFLDELQKEIWEVGEAIDAHFFKPGADLALHAYEVT